MRLFQTLSAGLLALSIAALAPESADARSVVNYKGIAKGAIVIKTGKRRLYYGLGNGKAIAYPVGVGRRGKQWTGTKRIWSKRVKPAWRPTKQIIRAKPSIKRYYGPGEKGNPMGAAALVLSGGGQYAIHGTNNPGSIGGFVSSGCIRMYNRDIRDLYSKVRVGTRVTVVR